MSMSNQFEEPETLATFDRSWQDKHEQLRLERGRFNDRPTFTLRLYWQGSDGEWRWSQAKPTSSGKHWQSLNLRGKELRALAAALIAAADDTESDGAAKAPGGQQQAPRGLTGEQRRVPSHREQKELSRFHEAHPAPYQGALPSDDSLPF